MVPADLTMNQSTRRPPCWRGVRTVVCPCGRFLFPLFPSTDPRCPCSVLECRHGTHRDQHLHRRFCRLSLVLGSHGMRWSASLQALPCLPTSLVASSGLSRRHLNLQPKFMVPSVRVIRAPRKARPTDLLLTLSHLSQTRVAIFFGAATIAGAFSGRSMCISGERMALEGTEPKERQAFAESLRSHKPPRPRHFRALSS